MIYEGKRYKPKQIEILSNIHDPRQRYEHPPIDYYRYGEYPRDLRSPGQIQPQSKIVWVPEE